MWMRSCSARVASVRWIEPQTPAPDEWQEPRLVPAPLLLLGDEPSRAHPRRRSFELSARPSRHREPGLPTGRASARRRVDRARVDAAPRNQPGGHRVRVPHVTGVELVSAPDEPGDLRNQVDKPTPPAFVVAQALRAFHGLANVGDVPASPAPDLVAEK